MSAGWLPLRVAPGSVFAQFLALWGFAVAQPLYDVLARHPEFLVAHFVSPSQLAGLALAVSFVLPGLLAGIVLLAWRISPRVGSLLHASWIGLAASAIALQLLMNVESLDSWSGVALAFAVGSLALASYLRVELVRSFVTLLALGAFAFPLLLVGRAPLGGSRPDAGALPTEPAAPAKPTPVVLVVLDELPLVSLLDENNAIDAGLFPALARFAGEANWYRNAIAASAFTNIAVPAIVTGKLLPHGKLATSFRTQPQNLFNLLAPSHEVVALEAMTQLCDPILCPAEDGGEAGVDLALLTSDLALIQAHALLPAPLRSRLVDVGNRWKGFAENRPGDLADIEERAPGGEQSRLAAGFARGEQAQADFDRFYARLSADNGERASLHFYHMMLPHMPWRFLPSGRSYVRYDQNRPYGVLRDDGRDERRWGHDEWLIAQAQQRHLLQTVYTDRLVGKLLARVREIGLYDRALVIVAADHGVGFVAGDTMRREGTDNLADLLFVPLLIKLPGQREGAVVDAPASTLDILPTIADVLAFTIPWPVEGRSLLDLESPPLASYPLRDRRIVLDGAEFDALRVRRDERVAQKLAIFGRGRGLDKLLRIGEPHALLGRRPGEYAQRALPHEWVAWIELEDHFQSLDPTAAILPLLIEGRVTGRGANEAPLRLAVSLNGRIEAVTRTFGSAGRFTAMLPEAALVAGQNQLAVHHIVTDAAAVQLAPIRVARQSVLRDRQR